MLNIPERKKRLCKEEMKEFYLLHISFECILDVGIE
jgi:hypothetical protein